MARPSQSRKPLTTYSHRRSRTRTNNQVDKLQSSPLQPLEDVSLSEMVHRMKKRSREVTRVSPLAESNVALDMEDAVQRLAKKPRTVSQPDFDIPSSSPIGDASIHPGPLQTQDINEARFHTPRALAPLDPLRPSTSNTQLASSEEPEFSPLPVAKRIVSCTSSGNLKENSSRGLASPFHSRPSSCAPSPKGTVKSHAKSNKRPPFHTKSRTLSAAFNPATLTQTSCMTTVLDNDQRVSSLLSPAISNPCATQMQLPLGSNRKSKSNLNMHIRTGSIPIMPSTDNSFEPWLVPPTALTSSQFASRIDVDTDHPSFYFDVPNEVSTPPRKRRATTGALPLDQVCLHADATRADLSNPQARPGAFESDIYANMKDSARPSTITPSIFIGRRPPRRRSRTINHIAGVGLFSSVQDSSTSASGADIDFPNNGAYGQVLFNQRVYLDGLSSVISATSPSLGLTSTLPPAVPLTASTSLSFRPTSVSVPALESVFASGSPQIAASAPEHRRSPGSDSDELRDLFSVLGLDGTSPVYFEGKFICSDNPRQQEWISVIC
ncbi:hypothetical protein AcW1_006864 [Taiwanofungus camphoratus]|nr:hypothetical protein AcV5_002673 [Antrodia cinnamomea]KAI0924882.1 hypothetical protein AcW2_005629 [Antrodia cinnamomea]KAI0947058.1 hypothetical protein AcV7_009597 [Antrodia cinnamomea]KAI0955219.1 hypothetical protein AcW1_006864 [Antrodia cinnamomea]